MVSHGQEFDGFLETVAADARNDQVRALRVRAALCPYGRVAGVSREPFRRTRIRLQTAVDRDRHGGCAIGRDGVQSDSGRRYRRPESANAHAPHPRGNPECPFRLGLRDGFRSGVPAGGARAQSAVPEAGASGAGRDLLLFVHQALHHLLALDSRLVAGNRASGGVDCRPRIAGPRVFCG